MPTLQSPTDEQLLQAFVVERDEEAFAEIGK